MIRACSYKGINHKRKVDKGQKDNIQFVIAGKTSTKSFQAAEKPLEAHPSLPSGLPGHKSHANPRILWAGLSIRTHSPPGMYRRNRLKQNFQQENPNKVWVSDITMLYVNYERYYLCVVIDLFSRKVIAHRIDNNQESPIVEKAFQDAYRSRNAPSGLLFHSDQGSQYTAYSFRKLLRSLNVAQSFSAPGCPYDNAVAETFFRTIKAEKVSRHQYKTEVELRDSVAEYIDFFNNHKPHQKFGYRTPNQVEADYHKT